MLRAQLSMPTPDVLTEEVEQLQDLSEQPTPDVLTEEVEQLQDLPEQPALLAEDKTSKPKEQTESDVQKVRPPAASNFTASCLHRLQYGHLCSMAAYDPPRAKSPPV